MKNLVFHFSVYPYINLNNIRVKEIFLKMSEIFSVYSEIHLYNNKFEKLKHFIFHFVVYSDIRLYNIEVNVPKHPSFPAQIFSPRSRFIIQKPLQRAQWLGCIFKKMMIKKMNISLGTRLLRNAYCSQFQTWEKFRTFCRHNSWISEISTNDDFNF